jgi:DNA-binding MarR family transcriptional regulator
MTSDIHDVADRIGRLVAWARRYAPTALSSTTVTTLDTLTAAGPLPISELARRERVSQPGMTTLVNRLEAAGHAERIADQSDRRVTLVRITKAGRKVLADRHATRTDGLHSAIAGLSAIDRKALIAAIPAIDHLLTTEAVVR